MFLSLPSHECVVCFVQRLTECCMLSMILHGKEFALPKVGDEWSFTCLSRELSLLFFMPLHEFALSLKFFMSLHVCLV